ncbi:MAG TPA: glycoside hydrolase family 3 protein [Ktedonobacterales bacterium]|nr:glycoside hydrolase family 3 protein [Ktedonobacterales bacterium]
MSDAPNQMSMDEQIGQLLMVGFPGNEPTPEVLDLIRAGHVGGIILFSRNLGSPRQILLLTSTLQEAARGAGHPYPLLIATDQENGIVRRTGAATTCFPGNMALGAINSPAATEVVARATGQELRALGITMNLAPDVDISNNPANPVIGVRSFGSDPELVARLGTNAVMGYQAAGVVATLKHFPGHGDTDTDSHLALPVVPFDTERLETVELKPFRRAIDVGAETLAVMTAHVAVPAITGSSTLPATLAPEVINGLLRTQIGFDGVVITDCLEMRAISSGVGIAEGAVRALQAGADIVLISHRYVCQMTGLTAIREAVKQGDLSASVVQAAAERVVHLKERLPGWDGLPTPDSARTMINAAHQRLADDLYAQSITIIRDEAGLLPLNLPVSTHLLVVLPPESQVSQAADQGLIPAHIIEALQRQLHDVSGGSGVSVEAFKLPERPAAEDLAILQQRAQEADVILVPTCNAHLPRNHATAQVVTQALLQTGRPLVGIAVCDPYDAAALPEITTWLATYDFTPPALNAAARVLVGGAPAHGTLPVTL